MIPNPPTGYHLSSVRPSASPPCHTHRENGALIEQLNERNGGAPSNLLRQKKEEEAIKMSI